MIQKTERKKTNQSFFVFFFPLIKLKKGPSFEQFTNPLHYHVSFDILSDIFTVAFKPSVY
jgi:hypothetical protein